MTKEEAIAIIRREYLCVDRDCDRACDKCDLMMPSKEPILEAYKIAIRALEEESTTKNNLAVDWDELKRKILMEVDGDTDDKWLRYTDVCDNISNSIDDFKADLRGDDNADSN